MKTRPPGPPGRARARPGGPAWDAEAVRAWTAYARPPAGAPAAAQYAHAGLLFAAGLAGHLAALAPTDAYRCV